jgi:predicted AAA+ superfamily ATPase
VDAVDAPGQFLLTGSAVPADDAERHTGAGRFAFLRLRPMSLVESGAGQGGVSLAALLDGQPPSCADPGLGVADLAELVRRGGWPAQLERPLAAAARAARDYLEQVRQVDVQRRDGRRRDPQRLGALLRSLGRNVATEVSLATLAADAGGADGPLDSRTVADHLQALERLMVLENQPAWRPPICVQRRPCARRPGVTSATPPWRWRPSAAAPIGCSRIWNGWGCCSSRW